MASLRILTMSPSSKIFITYTIYRIPKSALSSVNMITSKDMDEMAGIIESSDKNLLYLIVFVVTIIYVVGSVTDAMMDWVKDNVVSNDIVQREADLESKINKVIVDIKPKESLVDIKEEISKVNTEYGSSFDIQNLYVDKAISDNNVNGAYFVKNRHLVRSTSNTKKDSYIGIFKPAEEEKFSVPKLTSNETSATITMLKNNNSNGIVAAKDGIIHGESSSKEIAAYLMDHSGFAGVPETIGVSLPLPISVEPKLSTSLIPNNNNSGLTAPKYGSLQKFIPNIGSAEDYSSSKFLTEDVHAIGLLDLRLFNLDRHMGNILVRKSTEDGNMLRLVPIDHGFSLPDYRHLGDAWFEWLYWKQAKVPFNQKTIDYIRNINLFQDAVKLRRLGIRPDSILTYALSGIFVKCGVKNGWTLFDMGQMMQRDLSKEDCPSEFELLVNSALCECKFPGFESIGQSLNLETNKNLLKLLNCFSELCQAKADNMVSKNKVK